MHDALFSMYIYIYSDASGALGSEASALPLGGGGGGGGESSMMLTRGDSLRPTHTIHTRSSKRLLEFNAPELFRSVAAVGRYMPPSGVYAHIYIYI